ncbi:glycosyltransferase family 4 protein [Eubacterium sp. 1001713B170207_170306_E7]|uniref:glycosyltransferase family 4 protein n=1 Tax=Eubacterium sp. 1001713B170207_170306_E7 TaxID=2787097 RepID=UPI0018976F59|nr:glycosyltransferase family 4 protein [Eubacterium sp. 1001713B170207_170306_E7]
MEKNIWIFNQHNMPPEYGHLNRHYNFAKYLKKRGYNPVVFVGSSLHNTDMQIVENGKVCTEYKHCDFPYVFVRTCHYHGSMKKRIISMIQYYHRLFKATKNYEKPDVIIGSSAHPLAALAAIKLSRKYQCKNIVEIRDLWPESLVEYGIIKRNGLLSKILYICEKYLYKKADQLVFTMEGGKDYIANQGWQDDIDLLKVHHINNGIDLEEYEYNKRYVIYHDADLEDTGTFKVVYIGSIRKVNNIGMIVDAAKVLKNKSSKNIRILIYGDGNEREALKKRCTEEKIENIVFKGSVEKKYIPYILSKCDLNLMHGASIKLAKYGMSLNKSFDYLASGYPILSDIDAHYDYIINNNAGKKVECSSENIAEGILSFLNLSKDEYDSICENARKTALKYDFKYLTDQLIEIIEK